MASKLATAFVEVVMDKTKMDRGLKQAGGSLKAFLMSAAVGGVAGAVASTAMAAFAGLSASVSGWTDAARKQTEVETQLEAVLAATGGAAGFTKDELSAYATELQNATRVGDEMTMNAMAKLATFKSVSGDTFKQATELALDLSETGFGSVDSAAVMLGKALEDPIRGLSALRRVGVSFNEQQKTQIEQLVKAGKLHEAQAVILEGVAGQVGGVARAMGKADPIAQLRNRRGDIGEELGKAIAPMALIWEQVKTRAMEGLLFIVNGLRKLGDFIYELWDISLPLRQTIWEAAAAGMKFMDGVAESTIGRLIGWITEFLRHSMARLTVLVTHWSTVMELLKAGTWATILTMRDYFMNFGTQVLHMFTTLTAGIVDLFLSIPDMLQLAATEGITVAMAAAAEKTADIIAEAMTRQFEFAPDTTAARDELGRLIDELVRAKEETLAASRARLRAAEEKKKKKGLGPGVDDEAGGGGMPRLTGMFGLEALTRKMQEDLLKEDDPAEKTNSLLEADAVTQAEQLKALKKIADKPAPAVATD